MFFDLEVDPRLIPIWTPYEFHKAFSEAFKEALGSWADMSLYCNGWAL